MGVLHGVLFLILATIVSCKEYVPVLVWSTQTTADSYPVISALSRLTSNEFSDYLLKRVKVEKPMVLVFTEENLSVEDFSWRDVNENGAFPLVSNITRLADDVAFLPSVHNPYKALKKLKNHGYSWRYYEKDNFDSLKDGKNVIFEIKLDEPDYLEDRPDMLKKHDEQMAKVYKEALDHKSNVMVVYTGNHTSWMDADLGRFKREEKDSNDSSSSSLIINDANNVVRMSMSLPIIFKNMKENRENVINITKVIGTPTIKGNFTLRVRFATDATDVIIVEFPFNSPLQEWWTLNSTVVEINNEKPSYVLVPKEPVGAPSNYSYFCNPKTVFGYENVSLTFLNFQVQPRVGAGNSFGPIIHCIPYFSIAIWSGMVVVLILSVVLAWGIVMIMDINTNDRFDDPKGKTITITAAD